MRSLILRKNGRLLNDTFVHAQVVSSSPEIYERDLHGNLIPVFDNLIMYDPDAPNPMHPSPFPFLHWLNINNGHQVSYMGPAPPHHLLPIDMSLPSWKEFNLFTCTKPYIGMN